MRFICYFLAGICLFVGSIPLRADNSLGNIMPLGDSITAGQILLPPGFVPGGYRQRLYDKLTKAGYSFHFVGSSTIYPTETLSSTNNNHHEGHGGWTIERITNGIVNHNWLAVDPDIILLHIGTNNKQDAAKVADKLDNLLGKIIARSDARIYVAKIIGNSSEAEFRKPLKAAACDARHVTYNAAFEQKVLARAALGQPVSLVDMYSYMNINRQRNGQGEMLFADRSHPTQLGYDLMGDIWFRAITIPERNVRSMIIPSDVVKICLWKTWLKRLRYRRYKRSGDILTINKKTR